MKIIEGNVSDSEKYKGWFVGHFIEEHTPLKTDKVEIKWIDRPKGEIKKGLQTEHDAQTIMVLISGKMKIKFPSNNIEKVLSKEGDYVSYNSKDDSHESETLEDTKVIVIRWPSVQ